MRPATCNAVTRGAIFLVLCAAASLLAFGLARRSRADDPPPPVMCEIYSAFFGLDPVADALLDLNDDGFTNYENSLIWTDPRKIDTDEDGFPDWLDFVPISRAVLSFGDPMFTVSNNYVYVFPPWFVSARRDGGAWLTNSPTYGWHAPDTEPVDTGALIMEVDRSVIVTNLRMDVTFFDYPDSVLELDLADTNGVAVATNLFGNLLAGSDTVVSLNLDLPLGIHTNAARILLRRRSGAAAVYKCLLYTDLDGDGLDAEQEIQLGTSDHHADTSGDGLDDWTALFVYGLDPAVSNAYSLLPFFEGFEPPAVETGDLSGQNNWLVAFTNTAIVQSTNVFAGQQALSVRASDDEQRPKIAHTLVADPLDIVWADLRLFAPETTPESDPPDPAGQSAVFFFNEERRLVVYDGHASPEPAWTVLTNHPPVSASEWIRLTLELDYANQIWLVCLNGTLVAENLGFAAPQPQLTRFEIEGDFGGLDDIYIGPDRPAGLSLLGNIVPDDWLFEHFGHYNYGDDDDPDGDGLTNLQEWLLGLDPTVPDIYSFLPFIESFEPPAVETGDLSGQNNWLVSIADAAIVQTTNVLAGQQALTIAPATNDAPPKISQTLYADPLGDPVAVVWSDMRIRLSADHFGGDFPDPGDEAAVFFFNEDRRLAVYDGHAQPEPAWTVLTNHPPVSASEWIRLTLELNYSNQTWLVCLNGTLVAENLGFAAPQPQLSRFEIEGPLEGLDDIYIGPDRPDGLSLVGNIVPDEWLLEHFGHTGFTDDCDPNNDGLTLLQEYQLGLDPVALDTSGDGMPDAWKVRHGLDPLAFDPDDDPDGDGLTNLQEYFFGTDPLNADTTGNGLADFHPVAPLQPGTAAVHRAGTWRRNYQWTTPDNYYLEVPSWTEDGAAIVATNVARAEWEFAVTNAGMHLFGFRHSNPLGEPPDGYEYRLLFLADHHRIETLQVPAVHGTSQWHYAVTPWLPEGTRNLRLVWVNWLEGTDTSLAIEEVGLFGVDAPVTNINGRADWVDAILAEGRDTDGDGLSDLDELDIYGASPLAFDTDGDTLGDGEEILLFNTDPLDPETLGPGRPDAFPVHVLPGTATVERIDGSWPWWEQGDAIVNKWRNAPVSYELVATNAGMHRIGLRVSNWESEVPDDWAFQIRVSVNGFAFDEMEIVADNDWSATGFVNTPWLVEGPHVFTFEWLNSAYTLDPGRRDPNIRIEQVMLYATDAPATNQHGIQDWMLAILQLGGDTTGDGLSDHDEILIYGTDPTRRDTDGDGLSDWDEIMVHGSDPLSPDTSGDGFNDGWKAFIAADPTAANMSTQLLAHIHVPPAQTNAATGLWEPDGTNGIRSVEVSGSVRYEFDVETPAIYTLYVEGRNFMPYAALPPAKILAWLDGEFLGHGYLPADGGHAWFIGPWLTNGTHTLEIAFENVRGDWRLALDSIWLLAYGGPDSNASGVPDWMETRLANTSALDAGFDARVSPLFIEGDGLYHSKTTLVGLDVPVRPGAGARWFANVPLEPGVPADITVSFQDGAYAVSTNVAWTESNLVLDGPPVAVRKDDALLLAAWPENPDPAATVEIQILGVTNYNPVAGSPVPHVFAEPGAYTIVGNYWHGSAHLAGTATVQVVAAAFPSNPPPTVVWGKTLSNYRCPDIPFAHCDLEADPEILLSNIHSHGGVYRFNILALDGDTDRRLVARLKNGTRAILDTAALDILWLRAVVHGSVRVVETLEDGTTIVENTMYMPPGLPDGVTIRLTVFAGGALFENGTGILELAPEDFDEFGRFSYRMIIAPGGLILCHRYRIYSDGVQVGIY